MTAPTVTADDLLEVRDRTLVMGVVNVTPDSFSDGGEWFEQDAAISHGREVLAAGPDVAAVRTRAIETAESLREMLA